MLQKKILLSALAGLGAISFGSSAFAFDFVQDAGPYVGLQGGLSRAYYGNDTRDFIEDNVKSHASYSYDFKEGGLGGRIYAGWQFNPYLSLEGGYTQFADNKYSFSADNVSGNLKFRTNTWDVVGKASLPFSVFNPSLSGFSVYGKAGAAYVTADVSGDGQLLLADGDVMPVNGVTKHAWEPVVGVGTAYNFTSNFAVDVSFTHTQGHDTKIDDLKAPSTNFVALGISYKFDLINPTA